MTFPTLKLTFSLVVVQFQILIFGEHHSNRKGIKLSIRPQVRIADLFLDSVLILDESKGVCS